MGHRPTVYGLDIETDTTDNGLDPAGRLGRHRRPVAPRASTRCSPGREHELLVDLDERLRGQLEPA